MADTAELLKCSHAGDKEARDRLVMENAGLVWSIVKRFAGRGTEVEDLFQIGNIGLMKAIDRFDTELGVRFSTYAVPVILGEVRRLFRDGGSVKVSRSLKELAMRATREREAFAAREGREPSVGELADLLGVSPEQAAEALGASLPPLSLTRSSDEDEGEQIDVPVSPPEDTLTDRLALRQILGEMEPRDRALIVLRYLQHKTQQATAEELGMTQVQVSRRERSLLAAMRQKLIS